MFTQEAMHAALSFAQAENHKIDIYQLVGESRAEKAEVSARHNGLREKPSESDIQLKSTISNKQFLAYHS